jgi:hypothetical protein
MRTAHQAVRDMIVEVVVITTRPHPLDRAIQNRLNCPKSTSIVSKGRKWPNRES